MSSSVGSLDNRQCNGCSFYTGKPVFGRGKTGGLLIVGEAPGREELILGEPFVGRSGKLLRETLVSMNVDPESVYITNSCLCGDGRTTPDNITIANCRPGVIDEIRAAQPRAVLLMGATALVSVLQETGITKMRGTIIERDGLVYVPTFHPAAVLRDPRKFPDFQSDIEKAIQAASTGQGKITHVEPARILVKDAETLRRAIFELRRCERVALDIETEGLDPMTHRIIRIGLCGSPEKAYILYPSVFSHPFLRQFLEDQMVTWVGHNSMFDAKFLNLWFCIDWRPSIDTMLLHYCVDEQRGHGLKLLAAEFLQAADYASPLKKELAEAGSTNFGAVDDETLDRYLAWDVYFTLLLVDPLMTKAKAEGTDRVHDKILVPASHAISRIEARGALIDIPYLQELRGRLTGEIAEDVELIRHSARLPNFNVNSAPQVAALVYDALGLPVGKSGRSTEREVLENLQAMLPEGSQERLIVAAILNARQKSRVIGTYIDGMIRRADVNSRVHSEFLLHGTQTGRLSSANPNLQNIPVLMGPLIRRAFIAPKGWLVWNADYSQMELRIAAWYSGDHFLTNAYREGRDVHRVVASQVFNVPEDEVTYEQRYIAKYIDFGILYGRGAKSLAEGELKCSVREAQTYIDNFMAQFDGLREWIRSQYAKVVEQGYVDTPMGRRRRWPLIFDDNLAEIQRQSVNTPIQSLASDMCLISLTKLEMEKLDPCRALIGWTVHDSIDGYVREDSVEWAHEVICKTMKSVPQSILGDAVPFKADFEVGPSWGELEKVK